MKRGEVWWVDFEPSVGAANQFLNRVQVVPLTSNIERLYPSEAYVAVRGERRKALADQLTTVRVEHAILVQLGLTAHE